MDVAPGPTAEGDATALVDEKRCAWVQSRLTVRNLLIGQEPHRHESGPKTSHQRDVAGKERLDPLIAFACELKGRLDAAYRPVRYGSVCRPPLAIFPRSVNSISPAAVAVQRALAGVERGEEVQRHPESA